MFIFRCVCAHERVGGYGGVMLKRPEVVFGYLLTSPYYLRQGQIFDLELADSQKYWRTWSLLIQLGYLLGQAPQILLSLLPSAEITGFGYWAWLFLWCRGSEIRVSGLCSKLFTYWDISADCFWSFQSKVFVLSEYFLIALHILLAIIIGRGDKAHTLYHFMRYNAGERE